MKKRISEILRLFKDLAEEKHAKKYRDYYEAKILKLQAEKAGMANTISD